MTINPIAYTERVVGDFLRYQLTTSNTTRCSNVTRSRPLRAALRSVRTWTPSSAASASRGHSRLGSSRAAKARALATHGSGTARRPESQVRYVSAATPNTAANSVWDRCSCSRSARISHKGPVGAVRSFHRYCVLNTLPVERIAFVERSHVRLQLQKSFVQATRHYLRKREHLEMSYEALATSPWREVARAVEWLGLDFEPGQMDWAGKEHHHIQGNHLRRDRDGRISLDRRWGNRPQRLAEALCPDPDTPDTSLPWSQVGRDRLAPEVAEPASCPWPSYSERESRRGLCTSSCAKGLSWLRLLSSSVRVALWDGGTPSPSGDAFRGLAIRWPAMRDYRRSAHTIHAVHCHFVFCTKYRKPALRGDIGLWLRFERLAAPARRLGVRVLDGEPASRQVIDEIDLGAPEVANADGIDEERHAVRLKDPVGLGVTGSVLDQQAVLETGASATPARTPAARLPSSVLRPAAR